jgi:hypothetical protein
MAKVLFQKGHIPVNKGKRGLQIAWNKGKKLSEKHRGSLRISHLGYVMPESQKKKISKALKGKKKSETSIKNQANSHRGTKHPPLSEITRRKISKANSGENSHLWKGGISKEYKKRYHDIEYKLWREAVFKRDNFVCQGCKTGGIYITAHHIKSWAEYPELRYKLSNGMTLCENCHSKTDNYKGRGIKKKINK